ncbi:MAG: hypothetical protein K2R98_20850 [Gemmataceae bacterium]|nr:hypothetical protein [Gemmataceae bacterium]
MQLVAPDILMEARGLSIAVYAVGMIVGALLWVLGWWGHRFWIVLFTTVVGGVLGLSFARATGTQPFVAGLLLAISAGTLSLALSRIFAFTAGGITAWLLVRSMAPGWDEPMLCFLAGGLLGLFMFRAWTMVMTSLAGSLFIAYSLLGLLDRLGKLDALAWGEQRAILLNWSCAGLALLGWLVQFVLERWRLNRQRVLDDQAELKEAQDALKERFKRRAAGQTWWKWGRQAKPAGKAA